MRENLQSARPSAALWQPAAVGLGVGVEVGLVTRGNPYGGNGGRIVRNPVGHGARAAFTANMGRPATNAASQIIVLGRALPIVFGRAQTL